MASILLRNCFKIFCSSQEELVGSDILIQDGIIIEIGKSLTTFADREIDCSQLVVLPGMVNTHHHFYQTLTRNIPAVQNAELFDWLTHLYDIWKEMKEEDFYVSSLLAMGELLKTGCTATTDHHYLYPNTVKGDVMANQFRAADTLGMRFSPTRGSMSLSKKDGGLPPDSVVQTDAEILKDSERVIREFHDPAESALHKVVLAPCSPFSVSKNLMKDSAALAREYHVKLHTHLAETYDENEYCLNRYGKRPLALMEECDFLGEDVFFAHGIHFNDDELEVLKATGSQIAHCPTSNMRLGSGICRVQEMLKMGITVGLGVDGSASNDSSDMLGEVRNALLLQRVAKGAKALQVKDVLTMATENGARMLGYKKVGKIQVGWAADLALFSIHSLSYCGALSDPVAALVFTGYDHSAEYTIVNGKIVVEKRELVGYDEQKLIYQANTIAQALVK